MTTRLSVNVDDESADFIRANMAKRDISATEVTRRFAGFYKFWADEVEDGNKTAILEDENGDRQVVLPVL